MLGNGVKRKLEEDEDGVESNRTLLPGGVSRASYTLQRQTILNISLMKLYGPRTPSEPGLQRCVLINNVIRRIRDEFREEGGFGGLFFSVPAPATDTGAREDEGYRHQAAPPPPLGVISPSPLSGLDSCLTPASLLEEDPPLFFSLPPSSPHPLHHPLPPRLPLPAPPASKDSFSSALEEIEDLCPTVVVSPATSSPLSPTSSSAPSSAPSSPPQTAQELSEDVSMKEESLASQEESRVGKPVHPPPHAPPSPSPPPPTDSSSSPGAFLTDFALDDILFTDIDTSMYDFAPCAPPAGSPVSKMPPVVMADDLVKTISSYGGTAGGPPNQPFKMDLAELDHIMEVLVGS